METFINTNAVIIQTKKGVVMKRMLVSLVVGAMMVFMAGVAGADTLLFQGVSPSQTPTVYIAGFGSIEVYSGMYNFTLQDGSYAGSYKGFCVDPSYAPGENGIPNPNNSYTVIPVANGSIYEAAAYLLGTFYGQASTNAAVASEVQLAIWELIFDNGNVDIGAENFRYTGTDASAVATLASNALTAAANGDYYEGYYIAVAPNRDGYYGTSPQDFIFKTPEPLSLLLLGLGLIGVAGLWRKYKI
jgi:hypothetical protein